MRFTKKLLSGFAATAAATITFSVSAQNITGAGATFPFPIYAKWADEYKKATNVSMNYQSIGSGGGIKQIQSKTVDFGATDMPLKAEDLAKDGLVQFPAIIGGVVPVTNMDSVKPGEMKLTGPVLADIYLGKIKNWNDKAITDLNPGLKLDGPITVVRRSDGSGTTFLFVDYLSKVSPEWKSKVGVGTAVSWPEGVGGKGNEGVAQYVQRIKGSIGYVEYAYAKKNKLDYIQLKNRDGQFVAPDDTTFAAASAGADWKGTPGMGVILTDQAGAKSWPMTGASFILMHKQQAKPETGKAVLKFFDWALKNGQKSATELDYVPLPPATVSLIQAEWKKITDATGKGIY
ncbi:MAG: phosphate ABC transporter substrate-binding protein PstS [Betaproteobacteria bacterium]|nr:MAG: phosphate ABC transporter substrate-binding protein PstS [Betaproteobacteria bacterium]TAG48715.1 MAG: phosphate ABC transporter substrate-binding protein PstS [Betaproteobacteria bacterium]